MRTENSIKNSITSGISYMITMVLGFIVQGIFIKILGTEYLGLNSVFINILSILTLFELGFSEAIVYHLYKPIANNDINKIKGILVFYKKTYFVIGIIITIASIIVIPFLKVIIGTITININVYLIYILFIMSLLLNLVYSYVGCLIYVNQKKYIITLIHLGYYFLVNILQLIVLFKFKNYYLYLITKLICQVIEIIVIYIFSNKLYSNIRFAKVKKIDSKIKNNLFNNFKVLIIHKLSTVVVNNSDNILISSFLGLNYVGLYANYCHIVNAVLLLLSEFITSINTSVGNLLVSNNEKKNYLVFKKIHFLNFYLASVFGICLLNCIQPFIIIWIGKEYLLSYDILILIVFLGFLKMMRSAYGIFFLASGVWQKNYISPILEAIVIVVFSIIFMNLYGLIGIVIGGILSNFILWIYTYPKLIYKKVFNKNYLDYLKETGFYMILFILLIIFNMHISTIFKDLNVYISLFLNLLTSLIITNIILIIIFRKDDSFKYFYNIIKKYIKKN